MAYQVLYGEELGVDFLPQIMDIDCACYSAEYAGELEKMVARYEKNPQSFVCVADEGRAIGYINFFPVTPVLWEEIVETGMRIRDDDITPDEVADYSKEHENFLFIISVVIMPDYRDDRGVIQLLSDSFIEYLNRLESAGFLIGGISGTAVSEDGEKFLRTRMFRLYREIEKHNKVYLCDGIYLRKLLKNELYYKTYKDDVFLFLPYADNVRNTKIEKIYQPEYDFHNESVPETAGWLLQALDDCLHYEYQDFSESELKRAYLGEFQFLHTLDEYPDETDEDARPHIVGEERVYISVIAHRASHMYVVLLFIPDCKFSSSQVEDQLSQGYLKIRRKDELDERGFYQYQTLSTYLKNEYGLLECGKGKTILCMSNKPKDEREFYNILTAESYNSMHQEFHVEYDELQKIAQDNKAIYDYYDAYMTEETIAFILHDYKTYDLKERLELTATYIFIAEMVIFQNTALNKMTIKVSNALSNEGDVSYQYISELYQNYARTIKFWENSKFKYFGTQREANQIEKTFGNEKLRNTYYEQQDFLEHIVDLKNAQNERRNGNIINIVAIILAIIQVQGYVVGLLTRFYESFGIPVESATSTFDVMVIGGGGLILLIWYILNRKRYYMRVKKINMTASRRTS